MLVQKFHKTFNVSFHAKNVVSHVTPMLPAVNTDFMAFLPVVDGRSSSRACFHLLQYVFFRQIESSPDSKKSKKPSSSASVGEPTDGEPTDGEPTQGNPTQGKATAPDIIPKSASAGKANGSDPAVEQARAAFQGLQASVVENAQVRLLSASQWSVSFLNG